MTHFDAEAYRQETELDAEIIDFSAAQELRRSVQLMGEFGLTNPAGLELLEDEDLIVLEDVYLENDETKIENLEHGRIVRGEK